jgi:hypothetical protein
LLCVSSKFALASASNFALASVSALTFSCCQFRVSIGFSFLLAAGLAFASSALALACGWWLTQHRLCTGISYCWHLVQLGGFATTGAGVGLASAIAFALAAASAIFLFFCRFSSNNALA